MKKFNVDISLFQTMKFIYYINTNEIPGELSRENMISWVPVKSETLPELLPPLPPPPTPEHPGTPIPWNRNQNNRILQVILLQHGRHQIGWRIFS